jgi:hypothetical protein
MIVLGNCGHWSGRHLLGSCLLGALLDYHGGKASTKLPQSNTHVLRVQFLKEMEKSEVTVQSRSDQSRARSPNRRPSHSRVASTPAYLHPGFLTDGERTPLLRHRSMDDTDAIADDEKGGVAGGTILGIHNLAIVAPQFIVSSGPQLSSTRRLLTGSQRYLWLPVSYSVLQMRKSRTTRLTTPSTLARPACLGCCALAVCVLWYVQCLTKCFLIAHDSPGCGAHRPCRSANKH